MNRPENESPLKTIDGAALATPAGSSIDLRVGGADLFRLPCFSDSRGSLVPLENMRGLPFAPARVFLVFDAEGQGERGQHAHRICHQFLIAAAGELLVTVDDGTNRVQVRLAHPSVGLHLPPKLWGIQHSFSRGSVLMVIASHAYDPDEYIQDYDTFLGIASKR